MPGSVGGEREGSAGMASDAPSVGTPGSGGRDGIAGRLGGASAGRAGSASATPSVGNAHADMGQNTLVFVAGMAAFTADVAD